MKNIYFGGNSTTCGDELKYPEKERYSKIVSNHYEVNEIFNVVTGSSNLRIASSLYRYLAQHEYRKIDLVIVLWSDGTRYDHFFDTPINSSDITNLHQPISPNYWSLKLEKIKDILKDSKYQLDREIKNFYLRKEHPHYKIIEEYNNKVWNLSNQIYHYVNSILSVQSICKMSKIPYVMMNVSPFKKNPWNREFLESVMKGNQIHELHKSELKELLNCIDWSNWINEGLLNYTNEFRDKGYLHFFRHPTKEGHEIIANDLIEFIDKKIINMYKGEQEE